MVASLEAPVTINGLEVKNRLYRAPLLECAGEGEDAVDVFIDELEPAAASGVGLICQGATPVREKGGRVAPNMTSFADREFVLGLQRLTESIHDHGARIFVQLDHGGIRSLETWHVPYREAHPNLEQLAVSPLPPFLKLLDSMGFLEYDLHILSTEEVYDLARDFGRCAEYAVEAGYDGVHLAGANMGIIQQFLSPFYNRRDDEFGGTQADRVRFLEVVHDEIRDRVGADVPVMMKVPAETAAPWFISPSLSRDDGVRIAQQLEEIGFDALVPVEVSTFWDMSLVRGEYPDRAWDNSTFRAGYEEVFDSRLRARLVAFVNRLEARYYPFERSWNERYCARVKSAVSLPVLAEGGIRRRTQMDKLLRRNRCDLVGMARPFYAEPRIAARLLDPDSEGDAEAACENCNNCTVPQVTGARGVCRTPAVLRRTSELRQAGTYDSSGTARNKG